VIFRGLFTKIFDLRVAYEFISDVESGNFIRGAQFSLDNFRNDPGQWLPVNRFT
jgi:hypothetical protein